MFDFDYKRLDDGTYAVTAYRGKEALVRIPEQHWGEPVTLLGDALFRGHAEIEEVILPDTVRDIGAFVFDGCEKLKRIDLPDSLENMWQYSFARSSFEEIAIPDRVRIIVPYTYKDCKQPRRVSCGTGLTEIYSWAFAGCDSLKELYYGKGVQVSPLAFEWHF